MGGIKRFVDKLNPLAALSPGKRISKKVTGALTQAPESELLAEDLAAALGNTQRRQEELREKVSAAENITDRTRADFQARLGADFEQFNLEGVQEFDKVLNTLETELTSAVGGEGIFGRRQRREGARKLALDRPGQRQTRGALLTGSSAGGLLT